MCRDQPGTDRPGAERIGHRATLAGDARMTGWEMVAVAAGGIDAVVGSGTLVTYPVLRTR